MIEYLEIRGQNTAVVGIVDVATSIIWHSVYFGVGDFEIYVEATPALVGLLKVGQYVTRPDNEEVGIIESVRVATDEQKGIMITASGRFVKSILDRRLIYKLSDVSNNATVLKGKVETAVRSVVKNNAIECAFDSRRNISLLTLGASAGIPLEIVDENGNAAQKQVTNENLLTYTDALLEEYGLSALCILYGGKFLYTVRQGVDRSANNTAGNIPIVFCKDFDNLTASDYLYNATTERNVALIGGEGEGSERVYALLAKSESDLQRREQWVDASSIKRTFKLSEMNEMYPSGHTDNIYFYSDGKIIATLVFKDPEREYTLNDLQRKFPDGELNGLKFDVYEVTYANRIYGDEEKYTLTHIGYKAMLDANGEEGEYMLSNAVYVEMLKAKGKQDLAPLVATETFNGVIDIENGNWQFGRDFAIGDIVTVQDNNVGKYANVRITEATEVQDENGYTVEVKYQ